MAWHTSEYKRYLKSNAWAVRKSAYYRRHNRQCVACGSWKRTQLHHVTYDSLGHEPIGTWLPFGMPTMSMPHRAHQSKRFKDLRVATKEIVRIGRARQARHHRYRRLVRWLMTRLGRRRSDQRSRA
jgi:hypothetical protein